MTIRATDQPGLGPDRRGDPARMGQLRGRWRSGRRMPAAVAVAGVAGSLVLSTVGFIEVNRFGIPVGAGQELAAADSGYQPGPPGFGSDHLLGQTFVNQSRNGTADRYGGVAIRVTGARAVPDNRSGVPIVVVEVEAANITDGQIRLPEDIFSLRDARNLTVAADRIEFTSDSTRLVVDPGQRVDAAVVFRLKPRMQTYLPQFTFEIGDVGRQPAVLSLVPDPGLVRPYRGGLEVSDLRLLAGVGVGGPHSDAGNLPVLPGGGSQAFGPVDVVVDGASTDLDYGPYRAAFGQRLVAIEARVTPLVTATSSPSANGSDPLDAVIDRSWWHLHAGSTSTEALRVEVLDRSDTEVVLRILTQAPIDASSLALTAGAGAGRQHNLALLTLPSAPAVGPDTA